MLDVLLNLAAPIAAVVLVVVVCATVLLRDMINRSRFDKEFPEAPFDWKHPAGVDQATDGKAKRHRMQGSVAGGAATIAFIVVGLVGRGLEESSDRRIRRIKAGPADSIF